MIKWIQIRKINDAVTLALYMSESPTWVGDSTIKLMWKPAAS
jgi:hypothetical protein